MPTSIFRVALVCLLLTSCAGPEKLARQSDEALARGDLRRAYDRALRAVEKDPQNQAARDAYAAAGARVAADYHRRVAALAGVDTLAAANLALESRRFRSDVAHHGSAVPPSPAEEDDERAILNAAARTYYQRGRDAMAASRPKAAVDEYQACERYEPGYSDVTRRLDAAFRAATSLVALLPFADGVDVPGLSQEIAQRVHSEVSRRAVSELRFTQIVEERDVEGRLTLAQLRDLRREDALALGRQLGAQRVVTGRFKGLRSSNNTRDLTLPIYRRVEAKDENGQPIERWVESSLRVVTRERDVSVQCDFDVLDVRTGEVLVHRDAPSHTVVRVVWSDYRPEKDVDRYALLPPDVRKSEPSRATKLDSQWKEHVGSWKLEELLRHSRDQRSRATWSSRYRDEFHGDTRSRPVWLGELPAEDDMAFVALRDTWKPVLATLKELDARD